MKAGTHELILMCIGMLIFCILTEFNYFQGWVGGGEHTYIFCRDNCLNSFYSLSLSATESDGLLG